MASLHRFESRVSGMHQFHVYRGSPSSPDHLAICPTEEAADAAYRLLSGQAAGCHEDCGSHGFHCMRPGCPGLEEEV